MRVEARFRAMGSEAHLVVVGGDRSFLDAAWRRIEALETRWSRFRPSSEISLLNERAGSPVRVSPETLRLVRHALEGASVTEGRFDPTVLGDVVRAGYDRSLEPLGGPEVTADPSLGRGFEHVLVDPAGSTVTLPRGVGFDPGGLGKGLAADIVAEELIALGAEGVCVNLGGDLRVEGAAPQGGAGLVAIDGPSSPHPIAAVGLSRGAVATSARTRRSFGPPGAARHHLIDPRSGRPARSGLLASTVISGPGWRAEVLAKATFVTGARGGLALAHRFGAEALLVDDGGRIHTTVGFGRFSAGVTPEGGEEVRAG